MKYLCIIGDSLGFKVDGIHEILETDVPISDEIYNRFFIEQSHGKQLKIKNINGKIFEEIFEEIIPETLPPQPPSLEKRMSAIEEALLSLI